MNSEIASEEDQPEPVEIAEKKRPLFLGLTYAPPIDTAGEEEE